MDVANTFCRREIKWLKEEYHGYWGLLFQFMDAQDPLIGMLNWMCSQMTEWRHPVGWGENLEKNEE